MLDNATNPAEEASQEALKKMYSCIEAGKNFLIEAGAGAGKTYSLVKALKFIIEKQGDDLQKHHQKVACISFTNVASVEIASRIDRHPAIYSSTIHSFCWLIIKDFQPYLHKELPNLNDWWSEKLRELGGIGTQTIRYDDFGHRAIDEMHASIHHDDVLALTVKIMENHKFRKLLANHFPILFIDEYQDTNKKVAEALKNHFLDNREKPLFGFFGDHWQKIYGNGCGKIEHESLEIIGKKANFRSAPVIVDVLNQMRPELPQKVKDPNAKGSVAIYHTNDWIGERLTGQHWGDDLPAEDAHNYLEYLKKKLNTEGWDFSSDKTRILILTHNRTFAF